jgi:hypothetical protein
MQNQNKEEKKVSHIKASVYDLFSASKARKTYTNLGVSLILIIVFLVFALVPTIETIDKVKDKISIYEDLNPKLRDKFLAIKNLSSQKDNEIGQEIEFVEKVFQKDSNFSTIYLNIDERAKKYQTNIRDITFNYPDENFNMTDTISDPPSSQMYQVNISFDTISLNNAIAFVSSFEGYKKFPIPSRVQNVQFSDLAANSIVNPSQSGSAQTGINGSFTLIVYLDTVQRKS